MVAPITIKCCRSMASICKRIVTIYALVLWITCSEYSLTKAISFPSTVTNIGRFGGSNNVEFFRRIQFHEEKSEEENNDRNIVPVRTNDTYSLGSLIDITASAAATGAVAVTDQLTYMQTMTAGALSRTMAQTLMHPANTYKTLLQVRGSGKAGGVLSKLTPERLLRGVDAQFIMSLPHGAFYFFVIDQVKTKLSTVMDSKFNFLQDFASSTISTVFCSIVSTPQMVLTDRLMAGVYPTTMDAVRNILKTEGIAGMYTGWWPALAQKIPSYGLTWMFFQQLKRVHEDWLGTKPNGEVSFVLGAVAAAASVTVMIPMDTIKTRLVIQMAGCPAAYKGVSDCFYRILKEEGVGAFYLSLPPRLMSVVPMIAIQFGVYEALKTKFIHFNKEQRQMTALALKLKASKVRTSAAALASKALHKEKSSIVVNDS